MSIYCSIFMIGAEHKPVCRRMRKIDKGVYRYDESKPCTCGSCPIEYQGSHVLPSGKDKMIGSVDLGAIPDHITRNGRDDRPSKGKWYPWLRFALDGNYGTVILTRKQAKRLRDALTNWLENT